ncbi:MAG: DMT family transporter [Desulfarculaceae bacterium]
MVLDKQVFRADWLLLLVAVIWGTAFVAQRAGMSYVGPFTFNGVRFALGALILLPLIWRQNPSATYYNGLPGLLKARPALGGGLVAGSVLFLAATMQQVGLVYTTAGKAAFITGLYVIIVPLIGLFWGQRVGWGGWAGALLALTGLYLLSITESLSFAPGDLWEVGGAFLWAIHMLILGWLSPRVNVLKLAAAQFAVCSLLSLLTAVLIETLTWQGIWSGAVPILYGGLVSVGIAYTLQVVAQRHAPPFHAAIILSLEAVFAALAGWLVLDEVLSNRALAGCVLMFGGMLLAQLRS